MTLNVLERKILESAREMVRNGRESHICYAIDKATVPTYDSHRRISAKIRLRNYISKMLEGRGTLGFYLMKKYRQEKFPADSLLREARVAWITWMLGEEVVLDADVQRAFARYMQGN